jgi:hypothetical protein
MDTFSFGAPFLFIPRSQVFKHRIIIRYIVHINLCQAVYYRALRAAGCRARAWQPRDPRRLCELAVACTGCRAPAREPHLQDRGRRKRAAAFARGAGRGRVHDELGVRGAAVASAQSDRKRVRAAARSDLGERGRERGEVLGHEELGRWAPDERGGGPAERSVPDW